MKKTLFLLLSFIYLSSFAQLPLDSAIPVRGLSVAAPRVAGVDDFVQFIDEELAPANINLLILRVEYNYAYKSHPELQDKEPLTEADVKKLVHICRKHNIRLIPLLDLLGHQSYRTNLGNLLSVYPEFDETPKIPMPTEWNFPNNPGGLIMKSYCPLHPDVHTVVFHLVDELIDVFEADCFHAGMDEVFFIGHDDCPRCRGLDKAELFAGEVRTIRDHLAQRGCRMMIWGDRLLDGRATGTGMWEGSMNLTHRAIDMIPKDVFICDWHYESPHLTHVLFAAKGFDVAACPWRKPEVASAQFQDMVRFRQQGSSVMNQHFQGIIHTAWGSAESLMREYHQPNLQGSQETAGNCLRQVLQEIKGLLFLQAQ